MKVGDLVKHKFGTLQGTGIVLDVQPFEYYQQNATTLWTSHGTTKQLTVATRFVEVINEGR